MDLKNDIIDGYFNKLREKEYSRLNGSNQVYLDYTGANIHPACLVDMHHLFLQNAIYGNPHSSNPASQLSEEYVEEARHKVLEFFNAADYYCVFTNNASGALQIVGECYPFSHKSHFLLTADNHNSVNGIREHCRNKGGSHTYTTMNYEDLVINENELDEKLCAHGDKENKLFAFPAQSNASGVQHSLLWIKKAQEQGWDVLLDAAAFVPASKLDLAVHHPDFVSLSFYKMFGYPTGLGCLLVKRSKISKLKKCWFAGGTVTLSSISHNAYFLKQDHAKFENGTVNFLDIPAVTNGLNFISGITIELISSRITHLCGLFIQQLLQLRHYNGLPLVKLYGPKTTEKRGGTILVNFFDSRSQQYPFQYIEQQANAAMISIRTGCFCNPGIDELNNCISAKRLKSYFTSREQGGYEDMIQFLGQIRGAVRMSVGIPTTTLDIQCFIDFAKKLLDKKVPVNILPFPGRTQVLLSEFEKEL